MINEPSFGKLAKKHCLIVGTRLLKDSAYGGNSKFDDVPDILNMCPKEFSEKENLFVNELNKYVKHNISFLRLENDPAVRVTRLSNSTPIETIIEEAKQAMEDYINYFWIEMRLCYGHTDLSAGPTSFSEVPAESVFSVLERIQSG